MGEKKRVEFIPKGVCSSKIVIEVDEDRTVTHVSFSRGCDGNSKGISRLVAGMKVEDVISKLEGVTCGYKQTSCPDQLAKALKSHFN